MSESPVTIAISKGRILNQSLPLLARAGITPREDPTVSRRLVIDGDPPGVRFLVVRAADTGTYVRFGAADLGIIGKDQLLEEGGEDLYELLDLRIARCRMVVAQPASRTGNDGTGAGTRLRIGTKYPNIARAYFARKGVMTEPIKLYGSMELAPLVGLADQIVDLVDTGNTLRANDLVEVEQVAEISSRLVANKAAMKLKQEPLKALVRRIEGAVR